MISLLTSALYIILYISDMAFLYMWLKLFLGKRKADGKLYNVIIIAAVFIINVGMTLYAQYLGKVVLQMTFMLFESVLMALLAFSEKTAVKILYAVTAYIIEVAVDVFNVLNIYIIVRYSDNYIAAKNISEYMPVIFILARAVLKLFLYYIIIKIFYRMPMQNMRREGLIKTKRQYGSYVYILRYSVLFISCILLEGIWRMYKLPDETGGIFAENPVLKGSYPNDTAKVVLALAAVIGVIMVNLILVYCYEAMDVMLDKLHAIKLENANLKLEEKYYDDLDKLHEDYDIYIHDMKHTMRTIYALAEDGNYEEIKNLASDMKELIGNVDSQIICSHKILNSLLTERRGYAEENGVNIEFEITEPLYLNEIDDPDLIFLMGNLLDNAIEAEMQSDKREGIICKMRIAGDGLHLIIYIENSYAEKGRIFQMPVGESSSGIKYKSDTLRHMNIRPGEKHGIGLKSVNDIVKKYGGISDSSRSDGRYSVKIILPIHCGWEGEPFYTAPVPVYVRTEGY